MKIGYRHSEETRKKMSESAKRVGTGLWVRERGMSEETKIKFDWTGRKHTQETKDKMSRTMKGRKRPEISGSNHPNWKNGGIQRLTVRIRGLSEYKNWRSEIFNRDNFTCQRCHRHGGNLEAHHMNPFKVILSKNKIATIKEAQDCSELWNVANGITICRPCHIKTDSFGHLVNKYIIQ